MLRFFVFAVASLSLATFAIADVKLANLQHPTKTIWSGGSPSSSAEFAAIAKLGVRVIVSVDGSKPQIELAKRHGLTYIHIPICYGNIPRTAELSLVRLLNEVEGPFYFHCQHGKHRGPAMAAMAAVISKSQSVNEAIESLKTAGTSADYKGLWNSVRSFTPPKDGEVLPELVESAKLAEFQHFMALAGKRFERLRQLSKTDWKSETGTGAVETSALLHQSLLEAARLPRTKKDSEFEMAMHRAIGDAFDLRTYLKKKRLADATTKLGVLMKSCTSCHADYR